MLATERELMLLLFDTSVSVRPKRRTNETNSNIGMTTTMKQFTNLNHLLFNIHFKKINFSFLNENS